MELAEDPQAGSSSAEEWQAPESPDSSSSTNNELRTLAQATQRVITIPFRIIVNFMLQELGLSKAEYRLEFCEDNKVRMTILFNTSTLPYGNSPTYITIYAIRSRSYELAEDSACEEAIKYLERHTNSVMRDVSYEHVLHVKELNEILLQKMRDAHDYKKQFAMRFLAVRHMSSFSDQLLNIVYLKYYDGQDHAGTAWNSLLTNFQELALRLKHAGSVLERRVEEMRNEYFS